MKVCEIYKSVQGEGILTGTPSLFVRTSGCNLRCHFCDTPFASWEPEGESMTPEAIVRQLTPWTELHVVVTGGEPMIWNDLPELTELLKTSGLHVTIETAGTLFQDLECDLMSISPKLSNSRPSRERSQEWHVRHEAHRFQPEVVQRLIDRYPYQLKFVVDTPADLDEIEEYLSKIPKFDRDRVLFMPQGISVQELDERKKWLEPACQSRGVRYCDRSHLRWYGHRRGT